MPDVNLPLSGPVTQTFQQWNTLFGLTGSQISLFSVNVGQSSDDRVETDVIKGVASYGRQLGIIGDAMRVLVNRLPKDLSPDEDRAIDALKAMLDGVDKMKARRHGRATPDRAVHAAPSSSSTRA